MSEFINTIEVLGDEATMDAIIERTITEFRDDMLTSVGAYAFYGCAALETADLPNVATINREAFRGCSALENFNFSNVTTIGHYAFDVTKFTSLYLPKCTSVGESAFASCTSLRKVTKLAGSIGKLEYDYCTSLEILDVHQATAIDWNVNRANKKFKALVIRTPSVCSAASSDILGNGCFTSGTAYAYVPATLVDSYKAATNWSAISSQIRALEDYTVDVTLTGELDESKI